MSDDNMGTVAITGATGFLGCHVVQLLVGGGRPVRSLARVSGTPVSAAREVCVGNLADQISLRRFVSGCSQVVHLGGIAHTNLRTSEDHALVTTINVEGTRRLVCAAKEAGVRRFVFISTAHVYGDEGKDLVETSDRRGSGFYARSKIEAENIVLAAKAADFEVIVVRPCLIYGPHVRFNLERLMRAIHRGYYFHVQGHDPLRSFLAAANAARAIIHLLDHGQSGHAYNLADPSPVPLSKFVNTIAEFMGKPLPRSLPYTFVKAAALLLSPLRIAGFNPPITANSLRKLTNNFTLSTKKLEQSGFKWEGFEATAICEMAKAWTIANSGPLRG